MGSIVTKILKAKDPVSLDSQNVPKQELRENSKKDNSQENRLTENSDNCQNERGIPRTERSNSKKEEQDENKRNAHEIAKLTNDALLQQNSTLTVEEESIQRKLTAKIQSEQGLQKNTEDYTHKLETRLIEDHKTRSEREQKDMENERKCHLEKIEELGVKIDILQTESKEKTRKIEELGVKIVILQTESKEKTRKIEELGVKIDPLETESKVKTRKIEELKKEIITLRIETEDKETDMRERFDIELKNVHAQHEEDCTRHAKQHSDDMKQMQAQFDDLLNILRFDQKVGQDSVNAVMQRLTQVTDNTTSALNAAYLAFQSTSQQPKSGPSVRDISDTCDADDIE